MSVFQPSSGDFESVEAIADIEQISRPSLSYWQDAWVRLKQNTRALVSLWIIILLSLFTLAGPLVWQVDPALQDLNQVSQSPSLPKSALLVARYEPWQGVRLPDYVPPDIYPDQVDAPTTFELHEAATTQRVSCLLYTSPSPRDVEESRMPSSA